MTFKSQEAYDSFIKITLQTIRDTYLNDRSRTRFNILSTEKNLFNDYHHALHGFALAMNHNSSIVNDMVNSRAMLEALKGGLQS